MCPTRKVRVGRVWPDPDDAVLALIDDGELAGRLYPSMADDAIDASGLEMPPFGRPIERLHNPLPSQR
jgi:hypothetical protein